MKHEAKVALVRGKFLNKFEMQTFEKLDPRFSLTAFGSLTPFHDRFSFPVVKLASPMDIPEFPFKMSVLNRLFVDAHYLLGLEKRLLGFDLVHTAETYYHYTQQALDAKRRGLVKKVIATVLDNIPHNNEGIRGRKRFKQRSVNQLDHIIALTSGTKGALLSEGADEQKITVVGFGVDTHRFRPFRKQRKSGDRVTILFCGRFVAEKGVLELVSALGRLMRNPEIRKKNLRLVLVGSGPLEKKLFRLERELGVERFVRHEEAPYDRMHEVYREADMLVLPSKPTPTWTEQFGMVLIEAMASGLPVVATRTGAIPEIVGDAGILVPPADTGELARGLAKLVLDFDERLILGERARRRAVSMFDASRVAEKIESVYERVLWP